MTGAVLFLLLGAPAAEIEAPLVGRPRDSFYGAVGEQVRVTLSATRRHVRVEEELTLTLHVHGVANPHRVERPDLRLIDEFAAAFHIDDLDDGPEQPADLRYFRYRLRPKHDAVSEIPAFLYRYYNPALRYFATTVADASLPLSVEPRTVSDQITTPLDGPEHLFRFVAIIEADRRPPPGLGGWWLLAAWVGPAVASALCYAWWRWRHPDAARLAALRRTRAVREAMDALSADASAKTVVESLRRYFRARFQLSTNARTSSEIVEALRRAGLDAAVVDDAGLLLSACDAVRFGNCETSRVELPRWARELIEKIEDRR